MELTKVVAVMLLEVYELELWLEAEAPSDFLLPAKNALFKVHQCPWWENTVKHLFSWSSSGFTR